MVVGHRLALSPSRRSRLRIAAGLFSHKIHQVIFVLYISCKYMLISLVKQLLCLAVCFVRRITEFIPRVSSVSCHLMNEREQVTVPVVRFTSACRDRARD